MSASPGRGAAHILRGLGGLARQRGPPWASLAAVALRDHELRGPLGSHKGVGAGVRSRDGALALRHAPGRALWEDWTAAGGMLRNGTHLVRGALSSGWIAEIKVVISFFYSILTWLHYSNFRNSDFSSNGQNIEYFVWVIEISSLVSGTYYEMTN